MPICRHCSFVLDFWVSGMVDCVAGIRSNFSSGANRGLSFFFFLLSFFFQEQVDSWNVFSQCVYENVVRPHTRIDPGGSLVIETLALASYKSQRTIGVEVKSMDAWPPSTPIPMGTFNTTTGCFVDPASDAMFFQKPLLIEVFFSLSLSPSPSPSPLSHLYEFHKTKEKLVMI